MEGSPVTVRLLCLTLENLCNSRADARRKLLSHLFDAARSSGDLYGVVRLLLPKQDLERCNYKLREHALGLCLADALGLSYTSPDALLLRDWKQTGCPAVGNFSLVAQKVLATRQLKPQCDLLVSELNESLNRFAIFSHREAKANVLRDVIKKTSVQEMKWILRMILKDLRCGVGENFILEVLHPDARAMMQFCMDLKNVCEHLHSHSSHFKRQDVVVGKVLKSQLSKRQDSIDTVWEFMRSKSIVAEVKFDGDRMQVHKDGNNISFWSRNGKEHTEYLIPLQDILRQCISSERCVLDGEILVWDSIEQRFKQRTSGLLNSTARAVRKGWESDDQLCYVVFDVLFENKEGSVIHFSLKDRHRLIRRIVLPQIPHLQSIVHGDTKWAIFPTSKQQLSDFFYERIGSGDEGIVVKDLHSEWVPGNRDGRWCKIKPDYVSMGADHDLVIIGGYYGSGSRGGQVVSYLLALIDKNESGEACPRFITLCRCGVGFSEEEHALLRSKISHLFVRNKKGGHPPTTCNYLVTMSRFECPDVWISKPEKSVVLQITSEQRLYKTSTFRAGWTFRFPRVVRARYDKCWLDAMSIQEFEDMVTRAKNQGYSILNISSKCASFSRPHETKKHKLSSHVGSSKVLSHLQVCDVSDVPQLSRNMHGLLIFICNTESEWEREDLQKRVKRCGGKTVMNLLPSVTHIVAAKEKGVYFKVAVNEDRDILKISWLKASLDQGTILPIRSSDYLFQSSATREKSLEEMDCFGDTWYENIELDDLYKIVEKMSKQQLPLLTSNTCKWLEAKLQQPSIFRGCYLYFHYPSCERQYEATAIACAAIKRLAIECAKMGASVTEILTKDVTHFIVYTPFQEDFSSFSSSSLTEYEQVFLQSCVMEVLSHCWLDDCLQAFQKVDVAPYRLRASAPVTVKPPPDVHHSLSSTKGAVLLESICKTIDGKSSPPESFCNGCELMMKSPKEHASMISALEKATRVTSPFQKVQRSKESYNKTTKSDVERLESSMQMIASSQTLKNCSSLRGHGVASCRRIYGSKDIISAATQYINHQSPDNSSLQPVKNSGHGEPEAKIIVKRKLEADTCYRYSAINDTIEEHVSIWVSGIHSLSENACS